MTDSTADLFAHALSEARTSVPYAKIWSFLDDATKVKCLRELQDDVAERRCDARFDLEDAVVDAMEQLPPDDVLEKVKHVAVSVDWIRDLRKLSRRFGGLVELEIGIDEACGEMEKELKQQQAA